MIADTKEPQAPADSAVEVPVWGLIVLASLGAFLAQFAAGRTVNTALDTFTSECLRGPLGSVAAGNPLAAPTTRCYYENIPALLGAWAFGVVAFVAVALLVLGVLMDMKPLPIDKGSFSEKLPLFVAFGMGVSLAQVALWFFLFGDPTTRLLFSVLIIVPILSFVAATAKTTLVGVVEDKAIRYALRTAAFVTCVVVVIGVIFLVPALHP